MGEHEVYNLILNSSNVSTVTYNQYKFQFCEGGYKINKGAKICISQLVIPYSWFNVSSSLYNNNSFSYILNGTTYPVVLQSGNYTVSDINLALQLVMIANGHYLYNTSTTENVFYISLMTDSTYYSNVFYLSPIPTSLPAGYTDPTSSFPFSTSSGNTPQIVISSTNNFGSLIGLTSGTYPSSTTTSTNQVFGNTVPNLSPVNGLVVNCNLVYNPVSTNTEILDTFSIINNAFGSNINYVPNYPKWITIKEGTHHYLLITFQDQNFNQVQFNDYNILLNLMISNPPDENKYLEQVEPKRYKELQYLDEPIN